MADVLHMKDKGIPLKIDGTIRFVKGATKYTTCGDVIKMVLKKTGVKKEYRHLFTIYEITSDAENALPSKTRILKVVEAWRGEPNRLVLRKTEPLTPLPLNKKTKKWNLKKRSRNQVPAVREIGLANVETQTSEPPVITSSDSSSDSDMERKEYVRNETILSDTTTDSNSSMDEFLSNLDQSKLAGLINFFAAVAKHNLRKESRRSGRESKQGPSLDTQRPKHPRRIKKRVTHTKIRSREERLKEVVDIHPRKMHCVQRVNFGFIDVEPRTNDRVYSISDMYPAAEVGIPRQSHRTSAKIFSARRRLIPSIRLSYKVQGQSLTSEGCGKYSTGTLSSGSFKTCTTPNQDRYQELWHKRSLSSFDSGHEGDSDTSSDLDKAYVDRNQVGGVCSSPEWLRAADSPASSCSRRLVEYSITDDELDCSNDDFSNNDFVPICESDHEISKNDHEDLVKNKDCCYDQSTSSSYERELRESRPSEMFITTEKEDVTTDPELNNNVAEYIKSIFGNKCANEDEEMNSFMRSMVLYDSSDEGLSSMESDLEKEAVKV